LILVFICKQMKEFYKTDEQLEKIKTKLEPLLNNKGKQLEKPLQDLSDRNILDEVSIKKGEKSFTINKKEVYICLTHKVDGNEVYYNENMLIYVILHEISHVLCKSIGHTPEFFTIFDAVKDRAKTLGLWDPNIPIVNNYCGI
jgi:predicted metal-dependent hydrolase